MDQTYLELHDYLLKTQEIGTKALRQFDKNAEFHIIESLDMSIPYDVDRLSGGFSTGIYVFWHCKEPIIPVDTTVNCCTGSVFLIGAKNNFDENMFMHNLRRLTIKMENSSYEMNFDRGNHFISLCLDSDNNYYLIIHSTAKEFTKGYNGLYPIKGNWYYDKIQVCYSDSRYFRFISGKEAVLFSKTAKSLNKYNEIRHENIAYSILDGLYVDVISVEHFHHYGMEKDNAIKMGCYAVKKGTTVPIFSKPSYYIDLYEVSDCSKKTDDGRLIVPHGWGKHMKKALNIHCDYKNRKFCLGNNTLNIWLNESFYDLPEIEYRDYEQADGRNRFYEDHKADLNGTIRKRLSQRICLSSTGIEKY